MAKAKIDELNDPKFDAEEFIKEYFRKMPVAEERKEEREEAARDFRDVLLFILALIATEAEYGLLEWEYIRQQYLAELTRAAEEYAIADKALNDYLNEKVDDFLQITQDKDLSDPYWTSDERATREAVNEANSVVALGELQRAKALGAVKKRWKAEKDNRVRLTHQIADGKTVDIDGMFQVGEALMRFPGDFFHSVRESVNCRCAAEYINRDGKVVMVGKRGKDRWVNKTDEKVQFTDNENNDKIFPEEPLLRTLNDPLRELTGSAYDSNPKEVKEFIKELEDAGVEIKDNGYDRDVMGYSPGFFPGMPGQFQTSRLSSYGAWLHEMKHMRDDMARGWLGYDAAMSNKPLRYQFEKDAYAIEIEIAKKANRPDLVKRLRQNLKVERARIYGDGQ